MSSEEIAKFDKIYGNNLRTYVPDYKNIDETPYNLANFLQQYYRKKYDELIKIYGECAEQINQTFNEISTGIWHAKTVNDLISTNYEILFNQGIERVIICKKSSGVLQIIKRNPTQAVIAIIFVLMIIIEVIFIVINAILCLIVIKRYGNMFKWYEYLLIPVPLIGTLFYSQYLL